MFQVHNRETINSIWKVAVLQDHYDDERELTVFHNTTSDLQDQDQNRFFWSQTGLVLRLTVSDHITGLFQRQLSTTDTHRNSRRNSFRSTVGIHQKRSVAFRFAWTMNYHVWGAMLEAYHKLHPKSKSITELKEALQVTCDSLRQHRSTRLLKASHWRDTQKLTVNNSSKWLSHIRYSIS